ncbi:hypothetical protein Ssed_1959 [Shewanella sediminis HAW-EB3]|uniref:Uncharacterized protein n=1 Tax=Shewanella sediminis (strain HAW-EB3) TaxID=425104 RepID=A8FUP5_SHESH|nr:hypothetical protein [Shewanella sediminis]ABV36568.1 hypothetical protein Ssed_1959 [Shewanella sediminis HAW-EB3]
MKAKIQLLIEKLSAARDEGEPHCDISSSQIQSVTTPIPTTLYHGLEAIASEYNCDISCQAGDLLSIALEEAVEQIPVKQKDHMHELQHDHEAQEAQLHEDHCQFDAGGS